MSESESHAMVMKGSREKENANFSKPWNEIRNDATNDIYFRKWMNYRSYFLTFNKQENTILISHVYEAWSPKFTYHFL